MRDVFGIHHINHIRMLSGVELECDSLIVDIEQGCLPPQTQCTIVSQ